MFSFDWSILQQSLPLLGQGAMVTLKITITAIALGMVLGTLLAVARISVYAPMRWLSAAYVNCFRSIPLVMVLLWFYLIVPQFLSSFFNLSPQTDIRLVSAIVAFTAFEAAYYAEIVRAGMRSVSSGQYSAALALGMTKSQTLTYVILPQAFKNVLHALANEFIVLLKETSISGYIGLTDLTRGGDIIRSITYDAFLPLLGVAFIYLVLVVILSALVKKLERRLRSNERN